MIDRACPLCATPLTELAEIAGEVGGQRKLTLVADCPVCGELAVPPAGWSLLEVAEPEDLERASAAVRREFEAGGRRVRLRAAHFVEVSDEPGGSG